MSTCSCTQWPNARNHVQKFSWTQLVSQWKERLHKPTSCRYRGVVLWSRWLRQRKGTRGGRKKNIVNHAAQWEKRSESVWWYGGDEGRVGSSSTDRQQRPFGDALHSILSQKDGKNSSDKRGKVKKIITYLCIPNNCLPGQFLERIWGKSEWKKNRKVLYLLLFLAEVSH